MTKTKLMLGIVLLLLIGVGSFAIGGKSTSKLTPPTGDEILQYCYQEVFENFSITLYDLDGDMKIEKLEGWYEDREWHDNTETFYVTKLDVLMKNTRGKEIQRKGNISWRPTPEGWALSDCIIPR